MSGGGYPSAAELLAAVRGFVAEAEGALNGRLAFHAKVAANVLAIVERELAAHGDDDALASFGGAAAVCQALRDGSLNPEDPMLLVAIEADAAARLAIDNPRYATFKRMSQP